MKRRNAKPLSDHTPPVLHPLAATNLLSLWTDLSSIFYINGITHSVVLPPASFTEPHVPNAHPCCIRFLPPILTAINRTPAAQALLSSSCTQINMSGCARGKDWRGSRKDFQALAFHTYSHFVELPRPFPQLPTDFQKGLFFYSLVENHSKHTSFPNEEK